MVLHIFRHRCSVAAELRRVSLRGPARPAASCPAARPAPPARAQGQPGARGPVSRRKRSHRGAVAEVRINQPFGTVGPQITDRNAFLSRRKAVMADSDSELNAEQVKRET